MTATSQTIADLWACCGPTPEPYRLGVISDAYLDEGDEAAQLFLRWAMAAGRWPYANLKISGEPASPPWFGWYITRGSMPHHHVYPEHCVLSAYFMPELLPLRTAHSKLVPSVWEAFFRLFGSWMDIPRRRQNWLIYLAESKA